MHGRSVFGDTVGIPDPGARPRPIGYRVPTNFATPIDASVGTREALTTTLQRTQSMPVPVSVPGQRVGYGARSALTEYMSRTTPVTGVAPNNLPIGRPRNPQPHFGPQAPLGQRMLRRDAGIFARPYQVGGTRYDAEHGFGPPSLGASPDGLGFRGFAGLIGYR
jgi:hypothetical protein